MQVLSSSKQILALSSFLMATCGGIPGEEVTVAISVLRSAWTRTNVVTDLPSALPVWLKSFKVIAGSTGSSCINDLLAATSAAAIRSRTPGVNSHESLSPPHWYRYYSQLMGSYERAFRKLVHGENEDAPSSQRFKLLSP